jgi:hypothetical protein
MLFSLSQYLHNSKEGLSLGFYHINDSIEIRNNHSLPKYTYKPGLSMAQVVEHCLIIARP